MARATPCHVMTRRSFTPRPTLAVSPCLMGMGLSVNVSQQPLQFSKVNVQLSVKRLTESSRDVGPALSDDRTRKLYRSYITPRTTASAVCQPLDGHTYRP
jgi:hypothetical protein